MWKFIVDVVHDFVSSLQPDVGRGFLHVSNVFLLVIPCIGQMKYNVSAVAAAHPVYQFHDLH